ncbi:MAG: mannose-6-phosphate isomerase [Bacteroidetes bacterium HGW-Bacteroidetes-1]|jgi:mannose-6-phosphate isomerase|nr:MAG: mannose-6-phosphate isomerase [Bacteroidetes bacterium HGW-Bacteroidetes-1]
MQSLYPFKLNPVFKEKIWGGQKIKQVLNMNFGLLPNCGEAWLVSGVEGSPTLISNGYLAGNELNELVEVFMGDMVGEKVYERFGDAFPILVKVIDSNDWLSIQVHPDDELAQKRGIGYGKTEMWYVMQADENAELICGFNRQMDQETYVGFLRDKKLKEIMNFEKVVEGDVFFIPSGRIHALGPGTLIAEIQQTSDTTYRIYDWDRIDHAGMMRELHTEEALDAIDFSMQKNYKTPYHIHENKTEKLVASEFFTTNIVELTQSLQKDYEELDSFVLLMCIEGSFELKWEDLSLTANAGETILLPNSIEKVSLIPKTSAKLLEVFIA